MQTHIIERTKLHQAIDALPDESVIAMLNLTKSLQSNTNDECLPHTPNAETQAAITELLAEKGEKVTITQIMEELNAGN
jgi:hypothetical protein